MDYSMDVSYLLWLMAIAGTLVGYLWLQSPSVSHVTRIHLLSLDLDSEMTINLGERIEMRLLWIRRKMPSRRPRKKRSDDEASPRVGKYDMPQHPTHLGGIFYVILATANYFHARSIAHRTFSNHA
ncbi:hypothetical protein [Paenibacillus selenitireducens]|uniref:hypothetical protein n=1 Tax=Paenibacillus selenitireducens TaxID=1324314 RepID=UPI00117FA279|nr:hypothetical protein [Paenibacillus selenitireducens]